VPEASSLLQWFAAAARELPWRGDFPRDAYRVLVSEVMLQQTQVERVVPAYRRFLARFPNIEDLAAADDQTVLHAFSGLGYYRRARLLRAAAAAVVARGGWPRTVAELLALPGFGPYTAAAVAAFAFSGTTPPVDGNVERVAARHGAVAERLGSAALRRRAAALAAAFHAEEPTPAVFEALMELGARICTPATPACGDCPLAPGCRARARDEARAFPVPRRARTPEAHHWVALWVERGDGRVLLARAPEGDLLSGLFLPPRVVGAGRQEEAATAADLARGLGLAGPVSPVGRVRHGITHRRIEVAVYRADAGAHGGVAERPGGLAWDDPVSPSLPTSSLTAKIAALCRLRPA